MIDAITIPADQLSFTTRLIRDEVLRRNWRVQFYYPGSSCMRLKRPDGKVLEIFSATPPTTAFIASLHANDKFLTHITLSEAGMPVLETYLTLEVEEAAQRAEGMFAKGKTVIVKPLDSSHGHGVTVDITSEQAVRAAFAYAHEFSKKIIVQECSPQPIDLRLTCIGYKFTAGLIRIPARVCGDAHRTVEELILAENTKENRGEKYTKELNVIDIDEARKYLGVQMAAIPDEGEWVQVLGTANVGTGGETKDVTDDLPDWLVAMAENIASLTGLPVGGIDFLVRQPPTKTATIEELQPKILEVNRCPALHIHELPTFGKPRPVIGAYVDYLSTIE